MVVLLWQSHAAPVLLATAAFIRSFVLIHVPSQHPRFDSIVLLALLMYLVYSYAAALLKCALQCDKPFIFIRCLFKVFDSVV